MRKNTNYIGIDLAKIVMAIFVVAIHVSPERICSSELVRCSFRVVYDIAVPFFYMASGFLLFRNCCFPLQQTSMHAERVVGYLKRIFRLYVVWTILFLPLTVYGFAHDGISLLKAILVFLRNFLLVGENFYSWPLWYLLGLLVAVGLIAFLDKLGFTLKSIVFIALSLAVIGVFSDYWKDTLVGKIYFSSFLTVRNGLFVGFVCTSLGAWIAHNPIVISRKFQIFIAVVSLMLGLFWPSFVFTLICTFFFFQYMIGFTSSKMSPSLASYLRIQSTVLYFMHMLVLGFFHFVLSCQSLNELETFLLVCFFSLFLGDILIRYCSQKKFFNLLFK